MVKLESIFEWVDQESDIIYAVILCSKGDIPDYFATMSSEDVCVSIEQNFMKKYIKLIDVKENNPAEGWNNLKWYALYIGAYRFFLFT